VIAELAEHPQQAVKRFEHPLLVAFRMPVSETNSRKSKVGVHCDDTGRSADRTMA
jgi:hypothetical protein